ncbi:MAG: hypothetical protein DRP56_03170 [Planctomycetota bacterium]|nr:MAG: hypothetical protein DRP56_03170 [Planctomycetota bacterium]RKY13125.1 MAG: hypothetical protein DRP52_03550 [Planctomycetota bacterium]
MRNIAEYLAPLGLWMIRGILNRGFHPRLLYNEPSALTMKAPRFFEQMNLWGVLSQSIFFTNFYKKDTGKGKL